MSKLVRAITKDNLNLNGSYTEGDKSKPATLFIHGFTTDFYSHEFYDKMVEAITTKNQAVLMAQHRGTGMYTEFITKEKECRCIGSFYELLEEAHLDISAWIEFLLMQGYQSVVLIGHSLGTFKIVRYMTEGEHKDKVSKLILLSPFDKNAYVEHKTKGEWKKHIEIARKKVAHGMGLEVIPKEFDDYPTTYQTYLSWYDNTELNSIFDFYLKEYKSQVLKQLCIAVCVIVGSADEFLYIPELKTTLPDVENYFKNNIRNISVNFIDKCGHTFVGYEDQLAKLVSAAI